MNTIFDSNFDPMWVFKELNSQDFYLSPEIVGNICNDSQFDWADFSLSVAEKADFFCLRRAFDFVAGVFEKAKIKAQNKIVVTEMLKFIEKQSDKHTATEECMYDMIIITYLGFMVECHYKNQSIRNKSRHAYNGIINWFKEFVQKPDSSNVLCSTGEEAAKQYDLVSSVLFERVYALAVNCTLAADFISYEQFRQLSDRIISEDRRHYLNVKCHTHPVFCDHTIGSILSSLRNSDFLNSFLSYFSSRYSEYHWLLQPDKSTIDTFVEQRLLGMDLCR